MLTKNYHKVREELIDDAFEVSNKKGQDYTQKSDDALKNFKAVAERTGLTPYQVLGVYMMKHQDAIASFIEHGGQLESEPIKERIIDNINYLCLLWGLITEDKEADGWWTPNGAVEVVDPVEENKKDYTFENGYRVIDTNFGRMLVDSKPRSLKDES